MNSFIHEDFLLQNETAKRLYHQYACTLPIIDYHCHLSAQDIAENKQFRNLTELWLHGDHYKWRAMRANGIAEQDITGSVDDRVKFERWAETVPYTLRNPLYHWTHLELKKTFGIEELLSPKTAQSIWDACNEKLQTAAFSAQGLIQQAQVEVICTTDDPVDSLEWHQKIQASDFDPQVLPSWRADRVVQIDSPGFNQYITRLAEVSKLPIKTYADLLVALQKRHDFFAAVGCRLSDHGLQGFFCADYTEKDIEAIFRKALAGAKLSDHELFQYKSAMLYELAVMDDAKSWTQQFHVGAMRNNNTRMYEKLGSDAGFDSIGDDVVAQDMSHFLDRLNTAGKLTKTILYNVNPSHNEVYASMLGNFQDGHIAGKIQWGSGWWFLDQKDGMEKHMNTLSNLGLLSRFVGMLTDSRSFLSYSRHEYFRRILCNLIGVDVENGLMPDDEELLKAMVQNISYYNAKQYFGF